LDKMCSRILAKNEEKADLETEKKKKIQEIQVKQSDYN